MNAYHIFARFYDEMMADAPYEKWQTFFMEAIRRYSLQAQKIADIGCGTGKLSLFFADQGYEVYAMDPSPLMLLQLDQKLTGKLRNQIHLCEMGAAELELPQTVDMAVSFCDSLNYIVDERELARAFRKIHSALTDGGMVLFDLHTPYKIAELYGDSLYFDECEEYTYIWETHKDPEQQVIEHDLVFFVKEANGLYQRFDESHRQRAYDHLFIKTLLIQAGFSEIECFADFTWEQVSEQTERYFFIARKRWEETSDRSCDGQQRKTIAEK
ncbi:class I SAM-dependent methyltransferase [Fodinisporobacter ferrooxydans]|uniref:Class I SAM-dependent methyltransferase n=1 Tax=Fodinisporobacter ferrooxydans TaxID=2901836 RepID=A0ABY4CEF1_9BACL|nr:class I SAM-dependent methyltransferase [Alicyclobacillaceae bacterium MYW30-H2]